MCTCSPYLRLIWIDVRLCDGIAVIPQNMSTCNTQDNCTGLNRIISTPSIFPHSSKCFRHLDRLEALLAFSNSCRFVSLSDSFLSIIMGQGVLRGVMSSEPASSGLMWLAFDPLCLNWSYDCLVFWPVCCYSQNLINTAWQFAPGRMMMNRFDREEIEERIRKGWFTISNANKWILVSTFVSFCADVICYG